MSQIFPFNPARNQLFEYSGYTWQYNGKHWVKIEPFINWVINDGNGEGIYEYKTGTTIALKTLVGGSGITLSGGTDEILITSP